MRVVGFIRGDLYFNWQYAFWGVQAPQEQNCAGLKTNNILACLGWVMIDSIRVDSGVFLSDDRPNFSEDAESGIRAASGVFLSDGRPNFSEGAESLRGVYVTP